MSQTYDLTRVEEIIADAVRSAKLMRKEYVVYVGFDPLCTGAICVRDWVKTIRPDEGLLLVAHVQPNGDVTKSAWLLAQLEVTA